MSHHFLFDVTDNAGRRVTLTPETWDDHVKKRPIIKNALEVTRQIIEDPDVVGLDVDGAWRYCGRGMLPRLPRLYLQVTVRFDDEDHGRVATIYPVKAPEIETITWLRQPQRP